MILRPLTLATTSGPGLLLEQPIRPAITRLKKIAHRKRACAGERNVTFADNLQKNPGQEWNGSVYQVSEISAGRRQPASPQASRLWRQRARELLEARRLSCPPVWLRSCSPAPARRPRAAHC